MNAIVKMKLRFAPPPGEKGAKTIIVSPLPYPQQLPDWVKRSDGYEFCTRGDNPAIVEVELKKPAPKSYTESKAASEGRPSGTAEVPEGADAETEPKAEEDKGKGKAGRSK